MFQLSEKYNCVWELELLCRSKALETVYENMSPAYNKKLFLNVNPNVMSDENFKSGFTTQYLERYGISPENIIFEITERTAVCDVNNFKNVVEHYKSQSYKIAIDDVGSGYSGLNLIAAVKPHYLKLDMELIRHIDIDPHKRAIVKSMVLLSQLLNIKLIAEGIETKEELKELIDLGVHYGQGYYIQKPLEQMLDIRVDLVHEIKQSSKLYGDLSQMKTPVIADLCVSGKTISPKMKSDELADLFRWDEKLTGVCIIDEQIPRGIITKTNFFLYLGSRYGFSLSQNKSVASFMDEQFLVVDGQTEISEVTKLAMSRLNDRIYDFIVVTKEEKYVGIVTIKDLLEHARHSEVNNAKNLNPLTGLAGNLMIDHAILQSLFVDEARSVMYVDIDQFKVYNDLYGFKNGDSIIQLVAKILTRVKGDSDFIGHIGGDDFILICDTKNSQNLAIKIMSDFDQEIKAYYNEQDIERGFVIGKSRDGEIREFPIVSLSIAAIVNHYKKFENVYELTTMLAEVKKESKLIKGSSFIQWDEKREKHS